MLTGVLYVVELVLEHADLVQVAEHAVPPDVPSVDRPHLAAAIGTGRRLVSVESAAVEPVQADVVEGHMTV